MPPPMPAPPPRPDAPETGTPPGPPAPPAPPSTWRAGSPIPLRPLKVGETIDAAIRLYRLHWKVFLGIVATVTVPFAAFQALLTQVVGHPVRALPQEGVPTFLTTLAGANCVPINPDGVLIVSGILLLVNLLFIRPFLTAAMVGAVGDAYVGQTPTVEGSYRLALSKLRSVLLVEVLVGLSVLGGFVLFVIPGIIVAVRLMTASSAVVLEDVRGRKALSRSWRLTQDHAWRLFGTWLLASLLAGIVSGLLTAPVAYLANSMPCSTGWVLRAIAQIAVAVLVQPFVTAIPVLLYLDLRVRKEGLDLALMARELGPPER
jgi:hypothetical protein